MYDNNIAIYRTTGDVFFYVLGSYEENELILASVLNTLYDALVLLLRSEKIDKRAILENLDFVLLTIDELVDGGIILESEPELIATRVSMKSDDTPLAEQSLSQVVNNFRDQVQRSILNKT